MIERSSNTTAAADRIGRQRSSCTGDDVMVTRKLQPHGTKMRRKYPSYCSCALQGFLLISRYTVAFTGYNHGPSFFVHPTCIEMDNQRPSLHRRKTPRFMSLKNNNHDDNDYDNDRKRLPLQLLLIDHYDSFTYNLYDMLAQICETPPTVLAKDSFQSWSELQSYYNHTSWDGIILSPGPGSPQNPNDLGTLSPSILEENPNLPILGVCFGHQIMGQFYGQNVCLSPDGPIHGQVHSIYLQQQLPSNDNHLHKALWHNIPSCFQVVRYHSLVVDIGQQQQANRTSTSSVLQPTAFYRCESVDNVHNTEDQQEIVMGMQHREFPHFGVQFHPESIGTEYGRQLLRNFCEISYQIKMKSYQIKMKNQENDVAIVPNPIDIESALDQDKADESPGKDKARVNPSEVRIYVHKLPSHIHLTPMEIYDEFLNDQSHSVWLDTSSASAAALSTHELSSSATTSKGSIGDKSPIHHSCSILGAAESFIEYYSTTSDLSTPPSSNISERKEGVFCYSANFKNQNKHQEPILCEHHQEDILSFLERHHSSATDEVTMVSFINGCDDDDDDDDVRMETCSEVDLPLSFEYRGGHVGYLGYEVRHECQRFLEEQEHGHATTTSTSSGGDDARSLEKAYTSTHDDELMERSVPTAAFLFLDKSWVFDHTTNEWYLVCVTSSSNDDNESITTGGRSDKAYKAKMTTKEAISWMRCTADRMSQQSTQAISNGGPVMQGQTMGFGENHHILSTENAEEAFAKKNGVIHETQQKHNGRKVAQKPFKFLPNRSKEVYNRNFKDCQEQIRLGESYELCLTNQLEAKIQIPAAEDTTLLDLYKVLRRRNPAPYSAFLNWNSNRSRQSATIETKSPPTSFGICCSSPERFLSVKRTKPLKDDDHSLISDKSIVTGVDDPPGTVRFPTTDDDDDKSSLDSTMGRRDKVFHVEAKPIKGTCARVLPSNSRMDLLPAEKAEDDRRAMELQSSIKNRAENLMIVDLLRNDLSRVCEVGTVHVPKLMSIESFATVHHMVSTIRGSLNPNQKNAVDVLKACFPGGSMTGAPKIRTMEILDRLEESVPRGPYSGCLGYISMNGAMDMNIVIRTAVVTPQVTNRRGGESNSPHQEREDDSVADRSQEEWKVQVGSGGAITALSESRDEYEEMLLKASAVMKPVEEWVQMLDGLPQQDENPSVLEETETALDEHGP